MWPPLYAAAGAADPTLYSMTADGCLALSRAYAMESGAFVLHCTAACGEKGIEACRTAGGMFGVPGGGGSAVLGTDGRRVTEALGGEGQDGGFVEGIVFKDVELVDVVRNRGFVDAVGHYGRPDLLWLGVDERERRCVVHT